MTAPKSSRKAKNTNKEQRRKRNRQSESESERGGGRGRCRETDEKSLSGFIRKEKNRNEFSIEKHRKEENRTPKVAEKK